MTTIAPALVRFAVPIEDLFEDPANLNEHDDRSIAAIKASLARFGQQVPVIADCTGTVRAGNGTLVAARQLGWDRLAVLVLDTDDEAVATAYGIADNRSAEASEWDRQRIGETLVWLRGEGASLADLGWTKQEVEQFLRLAPSAVPIDGDSDGSATSERADDGERAGTVQASTLEFPAEADQAAFYTFMSDLRAEMPEVETPGTRLVRWAAAL